MRGETNKLKTMKTKHIIKGLDVQELHQVVEDYKNLYKLTLLKLRTLVESNDNKITFFDGEEEPMELKIPVGKCYYKNYTQTGYIYQLQLREDDIEIVMQDEDGEECREWLGTQPFYVLIGIVKYLETL